MCYAVEIELPAGHTCRFYLEEDYFHEYDGLPGRRALSSEEKNKQRERDKDLFLSDFYADYDWGPYDWSHPEFTVQNLLWLLEQIGEIADVRPPTNNAELEAVLKQAASEGWLIPEIDEYQGGSYAPPADAVSATRENGGILAPAAAFESYGGGVLRSSAPILSGPYDPATQAVRLNAARGIASSDGGAVDGSDSDLFGVVESAAAALLGGGDDSDDDVFSADSGDDSTPLGDAQPFDYQPDLPDGDVEQLAKSTINERYAAKMLGYDMDTFGGMIHALKDEYSLRGDDNVTFHDSGDVYFNGEWLDNIHTYAP